MHVCSEVQVFGGHWWCVWDCVCACVRVCARNNLYAIVCLLVDYMFVGHR